MKKMLTVLVVLVGTAALSGCLALSGKDYVMSYGVGVETGDNPLDGPTAYTFGVTISGR